MRLLIIRHGDPDYAIDSLTEKGWREAEYLSRRLEKENLTAAYLSPLGRAQDTARPTLEKTGLKAETLDWLHEFYPGVKTDYAPNGTCPWNLPPAYWSQFEGIEGRESWRQTPLFRDSGIPERYDEVGRCFDDLLLKHGYRRNGEYYEILPGHTDDRQTVALFCHLGLGNMLLAYVAGISLPLWWHRVFLPTSSVSTLFMEKHRPDGRAILRMSGIGDTSHLFAMGEPVSNSGVHSPIE